MHLKASRKNQQTPVHATNCLQRHGHPASPHSECSRLFFSAAVDGSTVLGRIEEVSRTLQTYKNQSHITAAPTGTVSYTAPHNPSLPLLSMPCSQPVRPLLGTHSAVFSTCRAQHGSAQHTAEGHHTVTCCSAVCQPYTTSNTAAPAATATHTA
jgi:hypothetical protein